MKTRSRKGAKAQRTFTIGGDAGSLLIMMAIEDFIFRGDSTGLNIARHLTDAEGNHPPLNEMITDVQCLMGRLLTTGNPQPA